MELVDAARRSGCDSGSTTLVHIPSRTLLLVLTLCLLSNLILVLGLALLLSG